MSDRGIGSNEKVTGILELFADVDGAFAVALLECKNDVNSWV